MFTEDDTSSEFDLKKDIFFTNFSTKHPKELKTLKKGNLLLPENENILGHSLTAGAIAELLCDLLEVAGEDKNDVISAAIIHDWDVLEEKKFRTEVAKVKKPTYRDLHEFKENSDLQLKEMGYSERIIRLTEENVTHDIGGPTALPEMIIFYTDAMLLSAKIVDIPLRFHLTKEGWHGGLERFDKDLKQRNKEYSENFFVGAPGHEPGKSHFQTQLETADKISKLFVKLLKDKIKDTSDPKYEYIFGETGDPNKLPYYIEEKINDRIKEIEI